MGLGALSTGRPGPACCSTGPAKAVPHLLYRGRIEVDLLEPRRSQNCVGLGTYSVPGLSPQPLTLHLFMILPAGSPPGWALTTPSVFRLISRFLGFPNSSVPELPATSLKHLSSNLEKEGKGLSVSTVACGSAQDWGKVGPQS